MISKEELRPYITDYLDEKGINYGHNLKFTCLSPVHTDEHPSMGFNEKDNKVKCFACNVSLDVFDLVAIDELGATVDEKAYPNPKVTPYDFKAAIAIVASRYAGESLSSSDKEQVKAAREEQSKDKLMAEKIEEIRAGFKGEIAKTDYLRNRGISDETFEKFGFYRADKNALVFDYGNGRTSIRYIEPKDGNRYNKNGKASLFNPEGLQADTFFLTEGEIDALSFIELGQHAVALGSVANTESLFIRGFKPREGQTIYLALDNDEAGQMAANQILKSDKFRDADIQNVSKALYGQYKDINERLQADRTNLSTDLININNTLMYSESAANEVEAFIGTVAERANVKPISSGFSNLDKLLSGGFYEGLYIMGAISSLGKTTLALQIADQIAKNGDDVYIFSLEMSKYELMAKSISRETRLIAERDKIKKDYAKTMLGIRTGSLYANYNEAELSLIKKATTEYQAYANHIFISEGVGDIGVDDIKKKVERHIRLTGRRPFVLIDYLQILAPYDFKASDKQNTDKSVMELKRLSRDCHTPVFAISSFNRSNYNSAVSMESFKESGAIEYSSDVLIGLEFEAVEKASIENTDSKDLPREIKRIINKEKQAETRNVRLKILKNRNGRTNTDTVFKYEPRFNMLAETTEKDKLYYDLRGLNK